MIRIESRLRELAQLGLMRRTRLVSGPQGPHVLVDGRPVLSLASGNYLGLADHPRVREAAAEAAMRWGVGAGGPRLAAGTMTIHRRLEERLAAFFGRRAALLFGSGQLAAAGAIAALARPGDVVFSDRRNSFALIDACRLSRAEVFVYEHLDLDHLAWGIEQAEGRGSLIVTEGLFALDGDLAPLAEIVELARSADLRIVLDEGHSLGTIGPGGRGAAAHAGVWDEVDVLVGTLGASLGGYGGFAACEPAIARYLLSASRGLRSCTAPAPPIAAGALAALELLAGGPQRVARLGANAGALRDGLSRAGLSTDAQPGAVVPWESPIVSLVVGEPRRARRIVEAALAGGVLCHAVLPPDVEPMASRLRLTAIATHREGELRAAARTVAGAARGSGMPLRRAAQLPGSTARAA